MKQKEKDNMTQEEKDLLLRDLCARLPYGVLISYHSYPNALKINGINGETIYHTPYFVCGNIEVKSHKIEEIKLYLRPMSNMTEEEKEEYELKYSPLNTDSLPHEFVDWLNAHHFDYRGLIEKGLALEAPEGMYDIK